MLVRQIVKQGLLLRNAGAISQAAAYHGGPHHKTTMNDLPVPAGDWQEQYARQNSRYNMVLLVGILSLAGTLGFAKSSGLIELNFSAPKSID